MLTLSSVSASFGCNRRSTTPGTPSTEQSTPVAQQAEEAIEVSTKANGQLGPGEGVILIGLKPPPKAKLTLDAPVSVKGKKGLGLSFPRSLGGPLSKHELPLRLPVEVQDGAVGPASIELSYFWCTEGDEAACRRETALVSLDLDLTGDAAGGEAHFLYPVPEEPAEL